VLFELVFLSSVNSLAKISKVDCAGTPITLFVDDDRVTAEITGTAYRDN